MWSIALKSQSLEKNKTASSEKFPFLIILLWAGAFLANVKSIFADYDVDMSYAVVTSYRHLSGERMFMEMWEPHQTSAFLLDPLMWIFSKITGGYDGIIIFLNISGVILYALLAAFLVQTLKKHTDPYVAHLAGIAVFAFRVRQIVLPEFTNMLSGFSILLIIFLIKHFEKKTDRLWLVLSALALCLTVLSYPSAVVNYIAVCLCIFMFSESKIKDFVILTCVCAAAGLMYLFYFAGHAGGLGAFSDNLKNIVSGDSSHNSEYAFDMLFYMKEVLAGAAWFAISAIAAFIVSFAVCAVFRKKKAVIFPAVFGGFLIITDLTFCIFFDNVIRTGSLRYVYGNLSLLLIVTAVFGLKKCNDFEKKMQLIAIFISVSNMLSVILLTNMELITAVQYLIPAGALSLISVSRLMAAADKEKASGAGFSYAFVFLAVLTIVMHRGIIMKDYSGVCKSVLGIEGIVKNGPAKGVVCSYMASYMNRCNEEDWNRFVSPGENVLVVASNLYDPIVYCFNSSSVSHYSTIDTPTYDETLLKYWELYPDNYPDVIAVECWYGDMHVEEDSWIMNWVESSSDYIGDGSYYRFYRVR